MKIRKSVRQCCRSGRVGSRGRHCMGTSEKQRRGSGASGLVCLCGIDRVWKRSQGRIDRRKMWRTTGLRSSLPLRRFLASPSSIASPIASTANDLSPISAISVAACKAVRGYAAKSGGSNEAHVEVPMPMYGVVGKYASALYITAVRANALDAVDRDLHQLCGAAERNPVFADFLKDPAVPTNLRVKAIQEIFNQTKFHEITKNFLAVMAENGRLTRLHKITEAFTELLLAHRGEVRAVITAALELSPGELEDIKNALKGHLKEGQTLKVAQKVDRSIIGGLVVDMQDKHIDLSISTRIKQMEKLLADPV